MIKFIKRNKLLSILTLLTILTFLIGILYPAVIDNNTREIISKNITDLISSIKNDMSFKDFFKLLSSNYTFIIIIWILGISIFGTIIVLILYLFKVFIFGFELSSLIINLKLSNIIFIILYTLPNLLYISIYFILVLFSISYSITLFKMIFLHKNYTIRIITKKYIKVLLVSLLLTLLLSIINIFIIPKLIKIFF